MKLRYEQSLADAICERISAGEPLRAICRTDGYPDERTVRGWAREDYGGFAEKFAVARELGCQCLAEQILEISRRDCTFTDENGVKRVDNAAVQQARIEIDSIKWLASKMMPRVYGDKITQEIVGGNGGPVQLEAMRSAILERISRLDAPGTAQNLVVESEPARAGDDPVRLADDNPEQPARMGNGSTGIGGT